MHSKNLIRAVIFAVSAILLNGCATTPMSQLDRYTAADVPAFASSETAVKPRKAGPPQPADLPGKGLAQHPMLYVGEGYNKMFLVKDGKIVWTYSTGGGNEFDDIWMLSNGNILFSRMGYVEEITPDKKVVWRFDAPNFAAKDTTHTEIHCCQPIGLDKVLFIENGLPPKLLVVNIKTHAVEVKHTLPCKSMTDIKIIHPEFRRVRYTAQGTYLVPFLNMGKVVEYDKNFNEVWSYDVKSPWAAIRLKNGNTLITDESDKKMVEVTPQKKIVWQLTPEDLPAKYRYVNTQSCTRLANGNTIVCSRGGGKGVKGPHPQLVEVTPDKKVVWVLQDWADLGPATAVQILDDPGVPENPGESEH